ncbi:DUF1294 domain-containing protein [Bacillus cytotoxicus]|uniref:DUF1294 domain-containing protein n=1 Tax=Bacillus cytotoxicus TaxID=580165 RepID=UPI003D7D0ACD
MISRKLSLFKLGGLFQWPPPERTLFLVAAAGGALGAWFGMYVFHHKTHKNQFVLGIPLLVFITIGLFFVV